VNVGEFIHCCDEQIKEYEMGRACSTNRGIRSAYRNFIVKPEGKDHLVDVGVDGGKILK
jgi:hypothetical protein